MKALISTLLFSCFTLGLFATSEKKQIKLRIQAPSGFVDETMIYFDQNINSSYSFQEDALKVYSGIAGAPTLYSLTSDNVECLNNGFSSLFHTEIIPLGVAVDSDATYTFTCPIIDNFDATTIVTLEDRQESKFINLRANYYQTAITTTEPAQGRFFLRVSRPATFSTADAGCSNNDGKITIQQDGSVTWTLCEIYDASNTLVKSLNNVTGQFVFDSLAGGNYNVTFVHGSYMATEQFTVNTHQISANITSSNANAYTTQEVEFFSNTVNATQFEWTFGDGTIITGVANPTLAFHEAGNVDVTLVCSNAYGCETTANMSVSVSKISGIKETENSNVNVSVAGKQLTVSMNGEVSKNAEVEIYNLLGKNVYSNKINSTVTQVSLSEQPAGYYLVSVKNDGKANTRRVYLGQ